MPIKKNQAVYEDDSDEFEFMDSQPSASSEDQLLERVLAERIAVAKEKKRQEREKRFLEGAASTLNKSLTEGVHEVRSAQESIEEVYAKFLLDYAASEDRIYGLWTEVLKNHQALESLFQEKYQGGIMLANECEAKHISGLSKMKGACQNFQTAVQSLLGDSEDDR